MIRLGIKTPAHQLGLTPITAVYGIPLSGRPTEVPRIPEGQAVICGYDQGLGEQLFACESLGEMQGLFDAHAAGGSLTITWYHGTVLARPDGSAALAIPEPPFPDASVAAGAAAPPAAANSAPVTPPAPRAAEHPGVRQRLGRLARLAQRGGAGRSIV